MRFLDLLPPVARVVAENGNPEIRSIAYDSRKVEPGALFLALKGETTDGNRYIPQAIERGAVAVISDNPEAQASTAVATVGHGRRAMAHVAAAFYGHPERKLALNGVTGTNGKTTTTFLIDSLLNSVGRKTALVGTIEYRIAGEVVPAPHTTPESLDLFQLFGQAVERGATEVAMEVSSHALEQGRVWGLTFDTAVFTNLTQDHLDYHGTMDAYFAAKQLLFEGTGGPAPRVAIINSDDAFGPNLLYSRAVAEVRSYGIDSGDWRAEDVITDATGVRFRWKTPFGTYELCSPLIGKINVFNLLAAATAAHARGLTFDQIAAGVEQMSAVPGRFERVDCGQPFTVIVDYAHTDDALRNVLRIAREFVGNDKRVITVFGCGGDRDKTKRPRMGTAAAEASDLVVVTSDNPRSEEPRAIIADILPGVLATRAKHAIEPDRKKAIELAIESALSGDIVIISGKGHEKTQTTREGVFPFHDVEVARELLIHHADATLRHR